MNIFDVILVCNSLFLQVLHCIVSRTKLSGIILASFAFVVRMSLLTRLANDCHRVTAYYCPVDCPRELRSKWLFMYVTDILVYM